MVLLYHNRPLLGTNHAAVTHPFNSVDGGAPRPAPLSEGMLLLPRGLPALRQAIQVVAGGTLSSRGGWGGLGSETLDFDPAPGVRRFTVKVSALFIARQVAVPVGGSAPAGRFRDGRHGRRDDLGHAP